ncbi:TPA: ribosome assembly factor SBDS [Candidatus Bathyarchaeota archaeon]|jgi:ribosome maturation protein SDO1|nr:ribosome assembly factor SBDS [Candidatus Bathyarchaeota archaeon]
MGSNYTLVRYQHGGEKYEILVDPDKGLSYKKGEPIDIANVILIDTIFTDSNKGEKASESKLKDEFKTSDPLEVAKIMFEKGTFLLTAAQRKEMTETKLKQIIAIISRTYVDPATKLPHPITRIENAMEEVRFNVDPFKSAEEQVKDLVQLLRPIMPMSSENIQLAFKIPPEHAARCYGIVKNYGEIKRDEWQKDGSWVAVLEMPAAMQLELLDKLGKATQGNLQSKILK